jgi:hypothetical protein
VTSSAAELAPAGIHRVAYLGLCRPFLAWQSFAMLSVTTILNIVCTEALEYSGVPEVPDQKHGAQHNYSALKRDARGTLEGDTQPHLNHDTPLQYDLELVRQRDGTFDWEE